MWLSVPLKNCEFPVSISAVEEFLPREPIHVPEDRDELGILEFFTESLLFCEGPDW